MAESLLQLYAQRQALPGHAFPPADAMFREFEATFEFEETPDQQQAINDVLVDMEQPRPMDRLVCGDVGYGKTEVAIRAALKAALGGKQVAVLAPTTVLVEHGKPMLFGAEGDKGLAFMPERGGFTQTEPNRATLHDETNWALAAALARLDDPALPTPLGVFYCQPRDDYNTVQAAHVPYRKLDRAGLDEILRVGSWQA